MAEHPVIFNGEMVRAILDGFKTQTRRVVTVPRHKGKRCQPYAPWWVVEEGKLWGPDEYGDWYEKPSPYGVSGDLLWVREKHYCCEVEGQGIGNMFLIYDDEFDGPEPRPKELRPFLEAKRFGARPSIHMPRWASRITLEVKAVRVERVQDINAYDACCEGALRVPTEKVEPDYFERAKAAEAMNEKPPLGPGPLKRFKWLWDSINAEHGYGWKANPWVWVIEFERVK